LSCLGGSLDLPVFNGYQNAEVISGLSLSA
jgi:hypothetical protein